MAEDLSDLVTFSAKTPARATKLSVKLGSDGEVESISRFTVGALLGYPNATVHIDGRALGNDIERGAFDLEPREANHIIQLAVNGAPTKAVRLAVARFQPRFLKAMETVRSAEGWTLNPGKPEKTQPPEPKSTLKSRRPKSLRELTRPRYFPGRGRGRGL